MTKKEAFIKALAEFLTKDATFNSVRLETNNKDAIKWAKLRAATPLLGYLEVDEAERVLTEFLA